MCTCAVSVCIHECVVSLCVFARAVFSYLDEAHCSLREKLQSNSVVSCRYRHRPDNCHLLYCCCVQFITHTLPPAVFSQRLAFALMIVLFLHSFNGLSHNSSQMHVRNSWSKTEGQRWGGCLVGLVKLELMMQFCTHQMFQFHKLHNSLIC